MRTLVKVLIVLAILMFILLWMMIPYFMEKPVIAVDYFSQYNELTRPADYTDRDNAAIALETLPMPESTGEPMDFSNEPDFLWSYEPVDYPAEFSPEEIAQLKNWIKRYIPTLQALDDISQKPYYYRPVDVSRYRSQLLGEQLYGYDEGIKMDTYEIQQLLEWAVAYYLEENDQTKALRYTETLLTFNKFFESSDGLYYYTVYNFIDRLNPDKLRPETPQAYSSQTLKALQAIFTNIDTDTDTDSVNDYRVEEICFLDAVQKLFTEGDNGHLSAPALVHNNIGYLTFSDTPDIMQCFYQCIKCEHRKKTVERMENILTALRSWRGQSLYQLHQQGIDVEAQIEELAGDNLIIQQYLLPELNMPHEAERLTCRAQAAATVIALFRYHRRKGEFPDTLENLAAEGYIDRLPDDPYAEGPLTYRPVGDEFILYSLGVDFEDDDGRPSLCKYCGEHLTDWGDGKVYIDPAISSVRPADPERDAKGDHLFWPVLEINLTP